MIEKKYITSIALTLSALVIMSLAACTISIPKRKPVDLEVAGRAPERTPIYEHNGWTIARASLHNHTIYSDGCRTPEDLLELARMQGMAVLAYTDHREGKMCLGKNKMLCVQTGGVEKVGYRAYYEMLSEIQKMAAAQDMIVTRGVEVSSPYFFNNGKFPHLVIRGQYKHFTVYDIQDPSIYDDMPLKRHITVWKPEPVVGDVPYQEFIDYVVDNGGIVHAVHVESEQDDWLGPVHVLTPAPVTNLHLRNLTGFSILPEAWHERTGGPGGLWDTSLVEYLAGMRERPLWASGDADYHGPGGSLAIATTLLYMREFTEEEVYRCMREGRMVSLQGESFQDSYVAEWWVSDQGAPSRKVMLGEEITIKGTPTIHFALDHPVSDCRVRLVRNGVVIAEQQGSELTFLDEEYGSKKEPVYYRVEVIGPHGAGEADYSSDTMQDNELFVNPIFVRFHD